MRKAKPPSQAQQKWPKNDHRNHSKKPPTLCLQGIPPEAWKYEQNRKNYKSKTKQPICKSSQETN